MFAPVKRIIMGGSESACCTDSCWYRCWLMLKRLRRADVSDQIRVWTAFPSLRGKINKYMNM